MIIASCNTLRKDHKHSESWQGRTMQDSQDAGKYQVDNDGPVQGQIIGDHNKVEMHFHRGSASQGNQAMSKIKALFLAANPTDTPPLAIDQEMRTIEHKVRAAEYRDALVFQSAWATQPDDLLQL